MPDPVRKVILVCKHSRNNIRKYSIYFLCNIEQKKKTFQTCKPDLNNRDVCLSERVCLDHKGDSISTEKLTEQNKEIINSWAFKLLYLAMNSEINLLFVLKLMKLFPILVSMYIFYIHNGNLC